MTARAHVESNVLANGVRIALADVTDGRRPAVFIWRRLELTEIEEAAAPPDDAWLHLSDDAARALYEALAQHYGHGVTDARRLRADYDHERGRVDSLIGHLIREPR